MKNLFSLFFYLNPKILIIFELYNKKKFFIIIKIILIFLFSFIIIIIYINLTNHIIYKNYINVAYSFDKNYHYIAHVSMKSIMLNQNNDTFINFYLLVSNLTYNQKKVIDRISLEHINCKINYIDMKSKFKEFNIPLNIWSTAIFYRINLQDILSNEKKILYLDTDTLIYKDLTKIYNYNISGKYYIGMIENMVNRFYHRFNISCDNYINTGVMLCNLEELRKWNISNKIKEFLIKKNNSLEFPVNDATNYITFHKNGYFTPEYVVIGFCNEGDLFNYYNHSKLKVNSSEVVTAYKDPYIYHFIMHIKPWRGIPNIYGQICIDPLIRFYEMAKKTHYYYKILDKFPIHKL